MASPKRDHTRVQSPAPSESDPLLSRAAAALKSRRAEDRLCAIRHFRHLGSPEAIHHLKEALRDRLSYVAAAAAAALIEHATPETAELLIAHFEWTAENGQERDPGCTVRTEIAVALGNMQCHQADDVLRSGLRTVQIEMVGYGLDDTAIGLRANCGLALAQLQSPGIVVDLTLMLYDSIVQASIPTDTLTARRAAAMALGLLGDPAAGVILALKLSTGDREDPDVLVECMTALAAVIPDRAAEFLAPYLLRDNAFLAAGAAMALAHTSRTDALCLITGALNTADADRVKTLAVALSTLRLPEAREALMERAGEGRRPLRVASIHALAVFPDEEVQGILRSLAVSDPDERVRSAAKDSLQ